MKFGSFFAKGIVYWKNAKEINNLNFFLFYQLLKENLFFWKSNFLKTNDQEKYKTLKFQNRLPMCGKQILLVVFSQNFSEYN